MENQIKFTALFVACLLLGLGSTVLPPEVIVTKDFFLEQFVVATTQYDVVNILLPLNGLIEFPENDDDLNINTTLFFTEADKDAEGKRLYKGLYVLRNKKVTKLLDQGTCAAADSDNSKTAYFGALDGIYKYNAAENTAEKYGSVDDSIIGIVKVNATDIIYILTEDYVVYMVTEEGTKKERFTLVSTARQIVLDNENNLYFYNQPSEIFALGSRGRKLFRYLPITSNVDFLAPPFVMDSGTLAILEGMCFMVYPTGSSEYCGIHFKTNPTAYSVEGIVLQYYAQDKKIYEYNLMKLLLSGALVEIKGYLEARAENIREFYSILKSKNRVSQINSANLTINCA